MSEQSIELKSVFELRLDASEQPLCYRIAAYQRGYRWTKQQVDQLLEDIRDFIRRENPQPTDFYCLQPLVLRADNGAYEVVDGQQRLTTLLLILRHFNKRLSEGYQQTLYTLKYDTRPDLLDFLEHPSDEKAASDIDFFHIHQAVKTIDDWFKKRENEVEEIKSAFLNRVKVIWFQLSPEEKAVEAFTRLNVGKIPLTNGELIRALFLRRSYRDEDKDRALRVRIAYEWDFLEKGLQNNAFWYFISNDPQHQGNRIGYLFDLVARTEGMTDSSDTYATFYHYSEKLNDKGTDTEQSWLEIKNTYMLLDEWFEDRRLYHLVGFLICQRVTVNHLLELAKGSTKREFKEKLRQEIFSRTTGAAELVQLGPDQLRRQLSDWLDGLGYGRDSRRIRSILLLFNLATLLQHPASNIRFQFESFKTAEWDIEHVRSVAHDQPRSRKGQVEWLEHCLEYLKYTHESKELQEGIRMFLALPHVQATDAVFEQLYEQLLRVFQEWGDQEADHRISNLVLLDYATNRSYKNAPFAVKRHRVLTLDRHGVFVPLCTRNVFLKCYNPRVGHVMFWNEEDMACYRSELINTITTFFHGQWLYD